MINLDAEQAFSKEQGKTGFQIQKQRSHVLMYRGGCLTEDFLKDKAVYFAVT